MTHRFASLDRRCFLRGTGIALALPWLETFSNLAAAAPADSQRKRLACFYMPDGVPMPLREDPAHEDWAWFPHGSGRDFTFTKCLDPLEPLRDELTVLSGFSHPSARSIHGHSNADQFLTGAATGAAGDYHNSISLDQEFAEQVGDQTRFSSLVLSTDGGTGTPRGAHTMSFNRSGRAIPAEHRPKRIFDMLFVKSDADAARRLALSQSALDDLLADAKSLRQTLSGHDQQTLDEYLQSVRETEIRVEKAKRWVNMPLPTVDVDHLKLDITPEDPRTFLRTMFELIYLAFKTDSTRVVTYQLGRENAIGVSDYLARAVGFNLTHQLTHNTKEPDGWKNFGTYCRFLSEEYGRFLGKLKETPDAGESGSMLDNTLLLFGSASSAFHLSRNYPLILAGGKNMGFQHGQYLNYGPQKPAGGAWLGGTEPWQKEVDHKDVPLANLFVTMLQRLGVETDKFADSIGTIADV
ncbi:DUF1552 domain-containing protein [Blastopirellula marina]|uniref:DUF1552 domain-containing protein n=1 Tax=Blastopirellula marina TaxID=124 RepID=A0A2S8G1S6_9BACT|nr:DUF1552 domain-containing protein [Blastopirellula marina]PQO38084.1 hypothetical protein C5Y98_08345 [Blastopirellula marina]PTL44740.1 DUF1552 domain-containing protein [Blastopirellula marina]